MRPATLAGALVLLSLAAPALAAPEPTAKERAKEAYQRGLAAHDAGDLHGAAVGFAEADREAPSPVALEAALDAAVDADDPVLGAELLERSARETSPGARLRASIAVARQKLGGRAGRIRVDCAAACTSEIDGRSVAGAAWVLPGAHVVRVRIGEVVRDRTLDVRAGETLVVAPEPGAPPPAAPVPPASPVTPAASPSVTPAASPSVAPAPSAPRAVAPARRHGLPRGYALAGAAATLVLAGGATVTGVLAGGKHDDFVGAGCAAGPGPACAGLKSDGEGLVHLTNGLWIGAAVAAVASAVLVVFTDWHPSVSSAGTAAAPGGLTVSF